MTRHREARLSVDRHSRVAEWNAAAEQLTGWSAAEALDRPLAEILPQLLTELTLDQLNEILETEGVLHQDMTLTRKDGRKICVDLHVAFDKVPDKEQRRMLISLREVTDRKQAEEALRQSEGRVAELERRLRQVEFRTASLETRLQRTEQERSDYIGTLSHELRNPLAAIVLGITLLKSSTPGSDQAHRAVEIMQRQTKHLSRMVDEMLDVARISEKRIELRKERLDLVQLAQRAIQDYQPAFLNKGITVSLDLPKGPLYLDGDPMRLSQAIGNLLDNAAKFSPEKGNVHVAIGCDDTPGRSHATISVEDTGIGIQPGIIENVFDPLVQADTSLRRGPSGLGLGLSLVKGIVELHGGQVRAASEGPGKGARFTIVLPLESGPVQPDRPPRQRAHRSPAEPRHRAPEDPARSQKPQRISGDAPEAGSQAPEAANQAPSGQAPSDGTGPGTRPRRGRPRSRPKNE